MPKIFKNMKLAKQVFADFKKTNDWYDEEVTEHPDLKKDISIDPRDLFVFVHILHFGHDYQNKEEYVKDLNEAVHLLKTNKDDALNKIYDVFESYDKLNPDVETRSGLLKAFAFHRFNQGFATAMQKNPDFLEKRYGVSIKQQQLFDACTISSTIIAANWNDDFIPEGINLNSFSFIEDDMKDALIEANKKDQYDKEIDNLNNNMKISISDAFLGKNDTISMELPLFFASIENMAARERNRKVECPKQYRNQNYIQFLFSLSEMINMSNTFSSCYVSEFNDSHGISSVYVDGKPLSDGAKSPKNSLNYYKELTVKFANAIKEGKIIQVATTYKVNDELIHKIIPVRFTLSNELKEQYKKDYIKKNNIGWIHKTFFDWGPWKIDPKMEETFNQGIVNCNPERKIELEKEIVQTRKRTLDPQYNHKEVIIEDENSRNPIDIKTEEVEIFQSKEVDSITTDNNQKNISTPIKDNSLDEPQK